ncbi:Rne/Rng family ribonuclease [Sandaracinus amylolyticus]|uniref:Ribonuclease G n=1 Tax=Sandaracinus amylolyticus TaxID=927083 RepID=A0A0F6YIJ0_9BACT|nr:Rne/Rng family ribonuclease [Sandaracinus amylolyticus]AKF06153.1 Cytoplasmic axial filament protein CafA and Ribonuclease G [Sandaracinus amylolyticus]
MAQNTIVISVDVGETRVALIENGILAEIYVERERDRSPVGNIYLGKVTRVLPGMQAAFVDVGLDRAAFLHVEDVIPQADFEKLVGDKDNGHDDDEEEGSSEGGAKDKQKSKKDERLSRKTPIRDVLKEGQHIVVQVSKGPISTKGARVTSHVSLPGRFVVYMPTIDHVGVSKRIGNDKERKRLREVIDGVKPPHGGLIVRTVAAGLTKGGLKADVGYLVKTWEGIADKQKSARKAPQLLYSELDIILRTARDLLTEDVGKIVIDDREEYLRLMQFVEAFMPERAGDIELYSGSDPIFDEFGIEDEIARSLSRKVPLPSGGYLIIDQAEALTAIDVNTGRFTGKGKDVEETILQTNLEAAKEIPYQLRFRNLGGLIVLDFIDMERSSHRDKVYKALVAALKNDKAKTTVVRISELGLVEMTRKRTRESLGRTLYEPCFYCDGTGQLQSKTTICHEILRQIRREKDSLPGFKVVVNAHPAVVDAMQREQKDALVKASARYARQIVMQARKDYHLEQFDLSGS